MRNRLLLGVVLAAACYQPARLLDPAPFAPAGAPLDAPDPSRPGAYAVKRFYYGSGTDRRRPEYRDSVTIKTGVVNATPFVRGADPKLLKERWAYWGFDAKRLPVNGRVWYPDAPGPFPLVLIVHGNHDMKKYSDPGYEYLGQLLASRGYILASVDENFLNGNLRGENDARGWMLLQHLKAWQRFDTAAASPMRGKVDWHRLALMGHSRGGEAVAVAAAFNRLARYPDDARVTFDFGFDLRSIVAIAPVDGQYKPADHGTPLADINYLVLHGAHDSDVSTFMGQRQYQRVRFTGAGDWRKSSIYIYRANHGQFNTTWGSSDVGPERGLFLRKSSLLGGEEQRQVAKVFISAWLDLTLRGSHAYEPLFRDARRAGPWVPRTIFLTRYERPGTRMLADFEEDVDVGTATVPGARLAGHGLTAWREFGLVMRARSLQPYENHAVRLGWAAPTATRAAARFELRLPDDGATAAGFAHGASLVFDAAGESATPKALAVSDTAPGVGPMARTGWWRSLKARFARDTGVAPTRISRADSLAKADSAKPIDFRIELETTDGVRASVNASDVVTLPPPLPIKLYKWARSERRFRDGAADVDQVLSRYAISLDELAARTPGFEIARVRVIRFVFDRTPAGSIMLDNVGVEEGAGR